MNILLSVLTALYIISATSAFYVENCQSSINLPQITRFSRKNSKNGERISIVFQTEHKLQAVKWFQDSTMRMYLRHYVLFSIDGQQINSSIGPSLRRKLKGGLQKKGRRTYKTWVDFNSTRDFDKYNFPFLSIIITANNCSQVEYSMEVLNTQPVIPKKLLLDVPPILVRLDNSSIGKEIKSNFSIDPTLGRIQYSRIETSVKRRRGFSTAYAHLMTTNEGLDEKETNISTKVTKTLIFEPFRVNHQGLYYKSAWVSQSPKSIFPHLVYAYTSFLLKDKKGNFGADVNGCSYGESYIGDNGIVIPVHVKRLDCVMCTSFGYPAPKVVLLAPDGSVVENAPSYVIGGIRTQSVMSVYGQKNVRGHYKCQIWQDGELTKTIPFYVDLYEDAEVDIDDTVKLVQPGQTLTITSDFKIPTQPSGDTPSGDITCSFWIGRNAGWQVRMKGAWDPLYKLDKTAADPILDGIPDAKVNELTPVKVGTRRYRLVLNPGAVTKAVNKYGDRFKIYSVLESKYVKLASSTAVRFWICRGRGC